MKKTTFLLTLLLLVAISGFGQDNSLNYDGTDDYVSLGSNYNFTSTDQFTLEAWVKVGFTGDFQQVISKLDSNFRGWGLQITGGGFLSGYLFSDFQVNQRYVIGSAYMLDETWHHVAMTFDGVDTIVLYVDGVFDPIQLNDDEGAVLGPITNSDNTHLGSYDANGAFGEFLSGNIDDVRIWNIARTGTEISDNYQNELNGEEDNLIGYYKFDIPNSTCDIQDCHTFEVHGTRNGASGDNDLPQFSSDTPVLIDVPCNVFVNCTLGMDDPELLALRILPNPTSGMLTVTGDLAEHVTFEIYNVLGADLVTGILSDRSIDISNLAKGIYFLAIESGNQRSVQRILKE